MPDTDVIVTTSAQPDKPADPAPQSAASPSPATDPAAWVREKAGILSDLAAERSKRAAAETAAKDAETLRAEVESWRQKESTRVEAVKAANAAALAALPERYRALVPAGLDPESAAAQIRAVAALVADRPAGVSTVGASPDPQGAAPSEVEIREARERGLDPIDWARMKRAAYQKHARK